MYYFTGSGRVTDYCHSEQPPVSYSLRSISSTCITYFLIDLNVTWLKIWNSDPYLRFIAGRKEWKRVIRRNNFEKFSSTKWKFLHCTSGCTLLFSELEDLVRANTTDYLKMNKLKRETREIMAMTNVVSIIVSNVVSIIVSNIVANII